MEDSGKEGFGGFESRFLSHVDSNVDLYIGRLAEAVAIPSISSDLPNHLDDVVKMMKWTESHATKLGGDVTLLPNPAATAESPLPPIMLGTFLASERPAKKKTLCVYGHLDVQPADIADGWDSDPFVLTEKNGKLYGRGSTDDKGPALSWLWIIEAHRELGVDLPVNIKILFEGMEESGSAGMFEAIRDLAKPGEFLDDVDFFCISDNYWLGKTKPCLTHGLRGMAYFELSVRCCEQDLHSGVSFMQLLGIDFDLPFDLHFLPGAMPSLTQPSHVRNNTDISTGPWGNCPRGHDRSDQTHVHPRRFVGKHFGRRRHGRCRCRHPPRRSPIRHNRF